jgi:hypothetical protein
MKKNITILMFLFLSANLFSFGKDEFTFDKKTGEVSDASGVVFKIEEKKSKSITADLWKDFYVVNKDDKRLIFFRVDRIFKNTEYRNGQRIDNYDYFFEAHFLMESDPVCEVKAVLFAKKVADIVYDAKLVKNGELDKEAVKAFVLESGRPFSPSIRLGN